MQHNLIYKYFKKSKAYAQAIGLENSNLVGAKIFLDFLSSKKLYYTCGRSKEVRTIPRTGRPKADNPKRNDIKVRLDDQTSKKLDEYCSVHKITRAEAIRRGIHLLLEKQK